MAEIAIGQNREARERIESARIALITERLGLSPEQAQKFWPLYNQYNMERRELNQQLMQARKDVDINKMTEDEGRKLMRFGLEIKEKQLQLEKSYSERMTDVVSSHQMLSLRKAEEDFRRMIIQRLEDRKRQQLHREQMKNRREELLKNKGSN
jgi:hypothetical protein